MIAYKLLNRDLTTYGGCQWVVGEKKTASGKGDLCGPGWLHGYEHAELAHFLNPIHANFKDPILYRVKVGVECKWDGQLKAGWMEMTLLELVHLPIPTTEQRVRFALACALQIYRGTAYRWWAYAWLDGVDQSAAAAVAAMRSVAERKERVAERAVMAAEWAAEREKWLIEKAAWAAEREKWVAKAAAVAAGWVGENCSLLLAAQFAMSGRTRP
jgi:hypothetical protein